MNKLLTLFLVLVTTLSFAQKGKVYTAATSLSSGNILEAKKDIDEALKDEGVQSMVKAWVTKGEIYAQIFQTGLSNELHVSDPIVQAEAAYKKAYELDMAHEKKPGKNKSVILDGLLNVAISYSDKGRAKYGEQAFDVALESFYKSADLITYLEGLDGLKSDNKESASLLRNEAYQNSALCALSLKDYAKATEIYNILLGLGETNEEIYANLAILYLSDEKFEEAKAIIEKGKSMYPENASLAESELNYYIGTNQSDKAVGKLEAAIEADPTNADLYFNLALAYDKLDQDDKMIEAYEKIIELDPAYYGAYLNLGAFYNEKANEVIKVMNDMTDYRAANKMIPQRDEWYNKAIPHLEKAHNLQPGDPAVKTALKRIYANMNLLDKVKALDEE